MPTFSSKINSCQILLNVLVGPPRALNYDTEGVVALVVDTGAAISGITPRLVEH